MNIKGIYSVKKCVLFCAVAICIVFSGATPAKAAVDCVTPGTCITDSVNDFTSNSTSATNTVILDWLPDLANMTEQMTAVAYNVTFLIGSFFDAKHQLEMQSILDEFYVEARRDYQPSAALCRFGTLRRSLASSEISSDINTQLLSRSAIQRETINVSRNRVSEANDQTSRITFFRNTYCNPSHMDGEIGGNASHPSICGGSTPENYDKDINYTDTIDQNLTLDFNLTNDILEDDERHVRALMNNLFSYNIFPEMMPDVVTSSKNKDTFLEMRSLWAARSLARHSYMHIVGQRSAGTGGAAEIGRAHV